MLNIYPSLIFIICPKNQVYNVTNNVEDGEKQDFARQASLHACFSWHVLSRITPLAAHTSLAIASARRSLIARSRSLIRLRKLPEN